MLFCSSLGVHVTLSLPVSLRLSSLILPKLSLIRERKKLYQRQYYFSSSNGTILYQWLGKQQTFT